MAMIKVKKTATIPNAPGGHVSLYVDDADGKVKQIDEDGVIQVLTNEGSSGTWTPVISGVLGAATVTIPSGPSYYTRVGDIVTETFHVNIAMDTLQTSETFNVSTAILRATNFTDDKAIRGTWSVFGPSVASVASVQIASEAATKIMTIIVESIANADVTLQFNHQYSLV